MKLIPNILTAARLFALPIFFLMVFFDDLIYRILFLTLAVIISITDFLDGYIARKYNATSKFGKIFDPIADKIFILVLSISILVTHPEISKIIFIPILVILIRELVISGIREGLASENIIIHVSKLAKYKTGFQMTALCMLILGGQENNFLMTIRWLGVAVLYISTYLTVLTAYHYLKQSYKNVI